MYGLSLSWPWIPVAILLIVKMFQTFQKRYENKKLLPFFLLLLSVGLSVGLANTLTSEILKPMVHRYRPCQPEAGLGQAVHLVNEHCGGKFGFASSHAANFFAAATFLSFFFRNKKASLVFFFAAFAVAYSRVYLGVHYPGDVVAGGLIGMICGGIFWRIWEKYKPFIKQ